MMAQTDQQLWEISIEGEFGDPEKSGRLMYENPNARVLSQVDVVQVVAPGIDPALKMAERAYKNFLRVLEASGYPRNQLNHWRVVGIKRTLPIHAEWNERP